MTRTVAVLFGPPAAGKSTAAGQAGLTIYDRDAPQWRAAGERAFRGALEAIRLDDDARAVIVRTGATTRARQQTLERVRATHAWIMLTPADVCRSRARARARGPVKRDYAAIQKWWAAYDHADDVPEWPGAWPDLEQAPSLIVDELAPRCLRCGSRHLQALPCWRPDYSTRITTEVLARMGRVCIYCHGANGPATTVDHLVPRSKGGTDGPENLAPACVRCNASRGNRGAVAPALPRSTLSTRWSTRRPSAPSK